MKFAENRLGPLMSRFLLLLKPEKFALIILICTKFSMNFTIINLEMEINIIMVYISLPLTYWLFYRQAALVPWSLITIIDIHVLVLSLIHHHTFQGGQKQTNARGVAYNTTGKTTYLYVNATTSRLGKKGK